MMMMIRFYLNFVHSLNTGNLNAEKVQGREVNVTA